MGTPVLALWTGDCTIATGDCLSAPLLSVVRVNELFLELDGDTNTPLSLRKLPKLDFRFSRNALLQFFRRLNGDPNNVFFLVVGDGVWLELLEALRPSTVLGL